jgi:hypothetical protein
LVKRPLETKVLFSLNEARFLLNKINSEFHLKGEIKKGTYEKISPFTYHDAFQIPEYIPGYGYSGSNGTD